MNKPVDTIILLWDRMGDYHWARVHALRQAAPQLKVIAGDLAREDSLYKWKERQEEDSFVLGSGKVSSFQKKRVKAFRHLLLENPNAVVGLAGYGRLEYLMILRLCHRKKVPVVMFAESWYGRGGLLDKLKGKLLRRYVPWVFASGKRAAQHFHKNLGFPTSQIFTGYSVVDNNHFAQKTQAKAEDVVLCVARFAPEKNLEWLAEEFLASELPNQGWKLRLVGGGPLKEDFQESWKQEAAIELQDWLSYEELPALYQSARVFVLASSFEPWGLVVNEALAAGLVTYVSEEVGCAPDLLPAEQVFPLEKGKLAEMLNASQAMDAAKKSQQLGRLQEYSPVAWAASFLQTLD